MFVAQAANYFGIGSSTTQYADGSWILNVIKCRLGRYNVRIIQHPEVVRRQTPREGFVHTTEIEIYGIRKFSEGEAVAKDLCSLLSFISMSQVVCFEFSFGGHQLRHLLIRGEAMSFRPVLEIRDGAQVATFLNLVWPTYRKLRRTRKLSEVIDMLTISELPNQPIEVKLAQLFILFENLKATYARSKKIPYIGGVFRKISTPPKANPKKEPKLGFEKLLSGMLKDVGMKRSLRRLIALRNEIIHFGLSRRPFPSLMKNYDSCQDIAREYILRLLGYKGTFLLYSAACSDVKEI